MLIRKFETTAPAYPYRAVPKTSFLQSARPEASASATAYTGPDPAVLSVLAMTVRVQRESTKSSTSRTGFGCASWTSKPSMTFRADSRSQLRNL